MLAIVNPPAIVPFFIHNTQGFSRAQKQRTILISSFSAFVVIATSALQGLKILEFFSISLTIPFLTGPATMSSVVIYAEKTKAFLQLDPLVGYGVVICLATALCFSLAEPIARVPGKTGINVMTRPMGLICAAVEVMAMAWASFFLCR